MTIDKKAGLIILFFLILTITTGCSGYWELSKKEKIQFGKIIHQGAIEECERFPEEISFITKTYPRAACYTEMAKRNKKITICDNISNQWRREVCFEQMAYNNWDLEICKKITDNLNKALCSYKLSINLAIKKDDVNVCYNSDLPVFEQEDCVFKYVLDKVTNKQDLNPKICQNIASDEHRRNLCLAYIKAVEHDCDSVINNKYNDYKKICRDKINEISRIDLMENTADSRICDNAVNKSDCYFSAAIELKRSDLCAYVADNSNDYIAFNKDYFNCIVDIAREVGGFVCEEFKDENKKNLCYYYSSVIEAFTVGTDL